MGKSKQRLQMLSWAVRLEGRSLWSENADLGSSVYGESLRKFSGIEYRRWDPSRSKLAAAIMRTKRKNHYYCRNWFYDIVSWRWPRHLN